MQDIRRFLGSNKRLLLIWALLIVLIQLCESYLFDFVLTRPKDLQLLSDIGVLTMLLLMIFFPFWTTRKYLTSAHGDAKHIGCILGLVASLPILGVSLALEVLDLVVKLFIRHDEFMSLHLTLYILGTFAGLLMFVVIGTMAGWIAQRTVKK